jgi:hypothetical protein
VRLRPLTEAECYALCYGGNASDAVSVVRVSARRAKRGSTAGEQVRERFEERLDARAPEAEAA